MINNARRLPSGYFDMPVDYNPSPPYDNPPVDYNPPPPYDNPLPSDLSSITIDSPRFASIQLSSTQLESQPEYNDILVQDDSNFVAQINGLPTQNNQPITRRTETRYTPLEEIESLTSNITRRIKEVKDKMTVIKNVVDELEQIPKERHDLININKIDIALGEILELKDNHLTTERKKLADYEMRLIQILEHKTEQDRLVKIFNRPQIREASGPTTY
ncbi:611_t:CDS:2 [Dentiscutata erythropus]|uniref:611_t:CDS:1 n=1 Tax=Dentiscutata erythropus TaxID=1348616 RepID=A0A9N9DFS7_9GLOM|nr:611_t:CDS:2 [Dentiscutata erythropus]